MARDAHAGSGSRPTRSSEGEQSVKPARAKTLDEVIDRVEAAMAYLESIPDDLYSPWDQGITEAFNILDDLSPAALRDELREMEG